MRLGSFELSIVRDATFRLDGGAMFGVIPKTLWERKAPADKKNRILLALNCLLIQTGKERILIDTGIGDKLDGKFIEIYSLKRQNGLLRSLASLGISPDQINKVVLTHLHFDHAGGNTRIGNEGKPIPTFPRAQYYIQRKEWEDALYTNERTKASYLAENFLPLEEARQLKLIEGDFQIAPGIEAILTGGHTKSHQVVLIQSGGEKAIFWGDLIPTTAHLALPYIMGYDLFPLETMEKKRELLRWAVKERWLSIFEHDPEIALGYLVEEKGKIRVENILDI